MGEGGDGSGKRDLFDQEKVAVLNSLGSTGLPSFFSASYTQSCSVITVVFHPFCQFHVVHTYMHHIIVIISNEFN